MVMKIEIEIFGVMILCSLEDSYLLVSQLIVTQNCRILITTNTPDLFLISDFLHVLYVVCFLLGNSLASEFYIYIYIYIKFRCQGITQKKTYNPRSYLSPINILCSFVLKVQCPMSSDCPALKTGYSVHFLGCRTAQSGRNLLSREICCFLLLLWKSGQQVS